MNDQPDRACLFGIEVAATSSLLARAIEDRSRVGAAPPPYYCAMGICMECMAVLDGQVRRPCLDQGPS